MFVRSGAPGLNGTCYQAARVNVGRGQAVRHNGSRHPAAHDEGDRDIRAR